MSHWNYRLVRYRAHPESLGLHEVFYNRNGEPCGMTKEPCSFASDWTSDDGSETPRTDIVGALEKALKAARETPILDEPAVWGKFDDELDEEESDE